MNNVAEKIATVGEYVVTYDMAEPNRDSTDIRFYKDGNQCGFGYRTTEGTICMIRCPQCERENYAIAVATGTCAFCGFNPNKEGIKDGV